MRFHPLAKLFPSLPESEMAELVEDIRKNGLRVPISVYRDQILDGVHRYEACKKAGVKPKFKRLPKNTDEVAFVFSQNLWRRHLNASQRALLAADWAKRERGRPKKKAQICAF